MKVKNVPSRWIYEEGLRLDCSPFMSGAVEARKILENLTVTKQKLFELTSGHDGGIYNGPKFRRNYVDSLEHGVPFLTSGNVLSADLSNLPLLRRKDAYSRKLSYLKISEGTTLISCSGTIGRMAYTRPKMHGIWSSQDVLKAVPNKSKILPGYLYAYLSGKYGLPQVTSGTYGAIIEHLEPQHIRNLSVPRFGSEIEAQVHEEVTRAADKRDEASQLLAQSQSLLIEKLDLSKIAGKEKIWSSQNIKLLGYRFDAFYFSEANKSAREAFDNAGSLVTLSEVSVVFIPNIFKRRYADDPSFGYPYITGADVFELAPTSDRYLMKPVAQVNQLLLEEGMILIQEAGQLSGLIGRSVQVGSYLDGFACTNNMVRVTPHDPADRGYLFTVLASEYGVRLIQREAAGSSIPHIEVSRVQNLKIPWPDKEIRHKIGQPAMEAQDLRDEACELENQARELVEKAIEEAV